MDRVQDKKRKEKTWKQKYDLTRKFQTEWAAKNPWSEGILKEDGFLY